MNGSAVVSAIDRFFSDLIGTVIPGALLMGGIVYIMPQMTSNLEGAALYPRTFFAWSVFLAVAYAIGHALTSVGHTVLLRVVGRVTKRSYDAKMDKIAKSELFQQFTKTYRLARPGVSDAIAVNGKNVRTWRNLALSEVDSDQSLLVKRFTFIALFNLGAATSLVTALVVWVVLNIANEISWMSAPSVRPLNWWVITATLLFVFAFLERHNDFQRRTVTVPFSMLLKKLTRETTPH